MVVKPRVWQVQQDAFPGSEDLLWFSPGKVGDCHRKEKSPWLWWGEKAENKNTDIDRSGSGGWAVYWETSRALHCSVPPPWSGVFPRTPGSWTDRPCGSWARSGFLGPKPVFWCFKWALSLELTAPSVLECVSKQLNSLSVALQTLSSVKIHYHRTLVFAITYREKSQVFVMTVGCSGVKGR